MLLHRRRFRGVDGTIAPWQKSVQAEAHRLFAFTPLVAPEHILQEIGYYIKTTYFSHRLSALPQAAYLDKGVGPGERGGGWGRKREKGRRNEKEPLFLLSYSKDCSRSFAIT